MPSLPAVVAFDVIETTFSTEGLRPRLQAAGLPAELLELWFASALRDAFAMTAAETYAPFSEVLSEALKAVAAKQGTRLTDEQAQSVVSGFSELEAHGDAAAAFKALRDAGVRVVTLTNGSAESTEKLLKKAGLLDLVERIITTDEVGAFKPSARVYRHAAAALGEREEAVALVAAHAWDIHGAKGAGLLAGFVARGQSFPKTMRQPDVFADGLVGVVRGFLGGSASP